MQLLASDEGYIYCTEVHSVAWCGLHSVLWCALHCGVLNSVVRSVLRCAL